MTCLASTQCTVTAVSTPAGSLSILLGHGQIEGGIASSTAAVDTSEDWSVTLSLDAGASNAGRMYWALASMSGVGPGVDLGFATVMLLPDALLSASIGHPNHGALGRNLGLLDELGRADYSIAVPAGLASRLAGRSLSVCYVTLPRRAPARVLRSSARW